MDGTGDTKLTWDPKDVDAIDDAQRRFDELKAAGYASFRISAFGGQGRSIDKFDPTVRKILMVPPLAGG